MRSLGVLCARGTSKRLPRKHLRPLLGIPLVSWMCRAAAASDLTRVIMSTEDDEIAAEAAKSVDVPFKRSAHLAEDFVEDFDIVVDALDRAEKEEGKKYDIVVMLQPTTPFTLPADINGCLERMAADDTLACCFTARPVTEPPQWMFVNKDNGRVLPILEDINASNAAAHKQLLPQCWFPSGAAYAVRAEALRAQKRIYATPYAIQPMPRERSIDIDEEADLILAEAVGRVQKFAPIPITPHDRRNGR